MIIHILRDITTAEPHAHGVAQQVVLYPVDALAAVAVAYKPSKREFCSGAAGGRQRSDSDRIC